MNRAELMERGEALIERVEGWRIGPQLVAAVRADLARGGGLLAAGVAFRLFLWLLPAALIAATALRLVRETEPEAPSEVAETSGLGTVVVDAVGAQSSQTSAFIGLLLGIFLLGVATRALHQALAVSNSIAWQLPVRLKRKMSVTALLGAALLGMLATAPIAAWLKGYGLGPLPLLVAICINGATWLGIAVTLPHRGTWRALVPGALLFAGGLAGMRLVTVYYLAPRLSHAGDLYGPLGTASVLLLWLYLLARLAIASAFVSAAFHDHEQERRPSEAASA